jgi:hypothetical protein
MPQRDHLLDALATLHHPGHDFQNPRLLGTLPAWMGGIEVSIDGLALGSPARSARLG